MNRPRNRLRPDLLRLSRASAVVAGLGVLVIVVALSATGVVAAQTADLHISPDPAHPGEIVVLDGRNSTAPSAIVDCEFDVDGDGQYERRSDTCLIEHTYQRLGNYEVRLRITTADGNQAVTIAGFSVVANESPRAAMSVDPEFPRPMESISLSGAESVDIDGTIEAYTWSVSGGNESGETITTSFPDTGEYEIALTITDDDGASTTERTTIEISMNEPPSATLSIAADTVDAGNRLLFDAGGSTDREQAIVEYRWDLDGDGVVDARTTTSRVEYEPTEVGEFEAVVTIIDDRGARDTAIVSYSVRDTPTETAAVTPAGVFTRTPAIDTPTPAGGVVVALSPVALAAILLILLLVAAGVGVRRSQFADEAAATLRELLTRGDIRRRLSRMLSQTVVKNVTKRAIRWLSDAIEAAGDGIGQALERTGRAIRRGSSRLAAWLRRLGS